MLAMLARYFRGCIVLAKQREGATLISAIAKPLRLSVARDLGLMKAGERWQLATSSGGAIHPETLPTDSTIDLLMETAHGSTAAAQYKIAVARAGDFAGEISYLLVFEQIES